MPVLDPGCRGQRVVERRSRPCRRPSRRPGRRAPRRGARARRGRPCERRTPPPARMTGRSARASSAAASSTSSGRGIRSGIDVIADRTGGTCVGSSSTSSGISTQVGPAGAAWASAQASASADGICAASRMTAVDLVDVARALLLVVELVQQSLAGAAEAATRDLARDHEQGHARGVRLLQRAERGERARPGGEEQHADLAGGAGVAVGAERGVVLDARAHELEVAAADRVEQAERVLARDAEHVRDAERRERLDDDVAAVAAVRRVGSGVGHGLRHVRMPRARAARPRARRPRHPSPRAGWRAARRGRRRGGRPRRR